MSWPNLADLKGMLGITDTTHDALLQARLDLGIRLIERYTLRTFEKGTYTETFSPGWCNGKSGHKIVLKAAPIESVVQVTGMAGCRIDKPAGVICIPRSCGGIDTREATIEYIGGFDPVPVDILEVLRNMLLTMWERKDQAPSSAGKVKKETIIGVASVEYFGDESASSASSADSDPALPGYYAGILDSYIRLPA